MINFPAGSRIWLVAGVTDMRCNRRDDEADAEILSELLDIISDMPSYGYRRVWGILRKQRRTEGQPPVNAKRLYRIMREHNLLLLHDKAERPKREHKGKIGVAESDMRWCSDGFEFGCDNGEKLRVTFALDCCDREAIDWAASTGGHRLGGEHGRLRQFDRAGCDAEVGRKALRRGAADHTGSMADG